MTCLHARIAAAVMWTLGVTASALAHPLDPALLEIRETVQHTHTRPSSVVLDVLWRLPAGQTSDAPLDAVLPSDCTALAAPVASESGRRRTLRWRAQCGLGLVGRRVGITGLREYKTDALLRIHLADGRLVEVVLRADAPELTIPARASRVAVLRAYAVLGFEHILSGYDHLLFVFGLVLLVRGRRSLLWTITAFTAGHSVTLSLAVLGFVHIPARPIEVLIALSLVLVATELCQEPERTTWLQRSPWAMAFSFGLLHGLGFAGALTEVGLPAHAVPLALGAFNAGIEVGQLLCVAALLTVRLTFGKTRAHWPLILMTRRIPAYAIGSLAVCWVCERLAVMF